MKLATVLIVFTTSVLAAPRPPVKAWHHSYSGSDASGWTTSVVEVPSAAASALDYTTYIGDTNEYRVARVLTDASGNAYIAGSRIIGTYHANQWFDTQLTDVFVTKLDSSGNLVFTVTIGGKGSDQANGLALDSAGNIYLGGSTSSSNFPLRNAIETQPGPGFLVKFSPDGSRLLYSTYFRGSINATAVDRDQNVYLTGSTTDLGFPITPGMPAGRVRPSTPAAVSGVFITKIASAGDRILYSGIISGNAVACGTGSSCFLSMRSTTGGKIALDAAGNAYITGYTNTTDLPTTPGALATQGIGGFVAKVNAAGSGLAYLTYIGAANYFISPLAVPGNIVNGLAVDDAGNAYLAGYTTDPKFPATTGAYQPTFSGPASPAPYPPPPSDAFVAKLRPDGTSMVWATYLGGPAVDSAQSIALDSSGNAWVVGTTASASFPNLDGWSKGGSDFLVELNPSGAALLYSARFPDGAVGQCVAADSTGMLHVAGPGGIVSAITPNQPLSRRVLGIANAAGGPVSGRIAPGELIAIFGQHIGPSTPATSTPDSSGLLPKSLAGVQVLIGDTAAPLLYVSDSQINAVVPFATTSLSPTRVRLSLTGVTLPDFGVIAFPTLPEIFKMPDGSAAAINYDDGAVNSPDHPAKAGSFVTIWANATGAVDARDGEITTSAQNNYCCQVQGAEVLYAGRAPGLVAGVTQINFRLPAQLYGDQLYLTITASGRASTPTPIYVTQ